MRIYTKTGDKGMTKLVGGAQVAKDSDRVERFACYPLLFLNC
jgi:cob(I)alamin adenosyltransferase